MHLSLELAVHGAWSAAGAAADGGWGSLRQIGDRLCASADCYLAVWLDGVKTITAATFDLKVLL
jgi:hypothetical protein